MKLNRKQRIVSYCLLPFMFITSTIIIILQEVFGVCAVIFESLEHLSFELDNFFSVCYLNIMEKFK